MFRYGGPIKEGVMSGIREPKKDGGKMLLVGQHPEQFKDAGGREQQSAAWRGGSKGQVCSDPRSRPTCPN